MDISRERRGEIIAALRKGTVPQRGLDFLAVGLGRFESAIGQEMANVAQGGAVFKAVRGDYGCGKTFFARWVQEIAKKKGFATAVFSALPYLNERRGSIMSRFLAV